MRGVASFETAFGLLRMTTSVSAANSEFVMVRSAQRVSNHAMTV